MPEQTIVFPEGVDAVNAAEDWQGNVYVYVAAPPNRTGTIRVWRKATGKWDDKPLHTFDGIAGRGGWLKPQADGSLRCIISLRVNKKQAVVDTMLADKCPVAPVAAPVYDKMYTNNDQVNTPVEGKDGLATRLGKNNLGVVQLQAIEKAQGRLR